MAGKYRKAPRPPSRKRKASARPVPPRPKGEEERTAVRRLAAMKYRLAGATYRVIAEKLTEERAQAYADANGISIDRAMKRIKHVSTKAAWWRQYPPSLAENLSKFVCLRSTSTNTSIFWRPGSPVFAVRRKPRIHRPTACMYLLGCTYLIRTYLYVTPVTPIVWPKMTPVTPIVWPKR